MAITFPASPSDGDVFTNSTTGVKYIYNATDGVWKTHVWPTNTDYLQLSGGTLTGDLSLGTNDLTAQDINSTTLTTTGSVTVGNGLTVSDGNIVMADGHGIDFSATGDGSGSMGNELFDDYEEGSWTPTLPNGGSYTGGSGNARYVKTGKVVMCYLYITGISGIPNNGTRFDIGGLPYPGVNISGNYLAGGNRVGYCTNAGGDSAKMSLFVAPNQSSAYLHICGASATVTNSTAQIFNGNTFLAGFQYQTD